MMKNIKSVAVLVVICSVIALLLAGTNQLTAPIIEANNKKAAGAALQEVLPEGAAFDEITDLSQYTLPASVQKAYKETDGKGYVVQLSVTGYGPDMIIMCGVNADNTVTGAKCLSSNETLSKEKEYGKNFIGKDADGVEAVETIGGATMTTQAYKSAVKDAINTAIILGGGEVDIRTPEQILADNLAAALPDAGGEFEKLFIAEVIEGIDAIYEAANGGYVCVIGEQFVGVNAEGKVITEGVENAAAIEAQIAILEASSSTDVDLTAYEGINSNITAIKKTASGNYIITINGLGFGYFGDETNYQPAKNIPMVIRVSLTPDGKIIDTLTVSHEESKGYGAAWGTEEYYGQFDGKTVETYKDVDTISGATISNNGYMKAIERCFEAVSILEGGAA